MVCQHVQEHLSSHTKRVFDSPVLPAAQAYVAAVPMEFLHLLLGQVLAFIHTHGCDASSIILVFDDLHLQHHLLVFVLSLDTDLVSKASWFPTCMLNTAYK